MDDPLQSPSDTLCAEYDALQEIARRLEIRAAEAERPTSDILRSLAANLDRCAVRVLLVSTDLAISRVAAEQDAMQRTILSLDETLPFWIRPAFLQNLVELAERVILLRMITHPHG